MNGFLVLLCTSLDDLPVGLLPDLKSAVQLADAVFEDMDGPETERARKLMGRDPTHAATVRVVQFRGGRPAYVVHQRDVLDG